MTFLQLKRAPLDHGVFTQHSRGTLIFIAAVRVDDLLFGGTTEDMQRFQSALRGALAAEPTKSGALNFTGVRVNTVAGDVTGGISIAADQEPYVDSIESIDITPERAATPHARLTAAELTLYRRATWALLWATGQTMPYLACTASALGRQFTRAAVNDLAAANRDIKAVRAARPRPLVFRALCGGLRMRLFVDASRVKRGGLTAHTGVSEFASPANGATGLLRPNTHLTLFAYDSNRQRRFTDSKRTWTVQSAFQNSRRRLVCSIAAPHHAPCTIR